MTTSPLHESRSQHIVGTYLHSRRHFQGTIRRYKWAHSRTEGSITAYLITKALEMEGVSQ